MLLRLPASRVEHPGAPPKQLERLQLNSVALAFTDDLDEPGSDVCGEELGIGQPLRLKNLGDRIGRLIDEEFEKIREDLKGLVRKRVRELIDN